MASMLALPVSYNQTFCARVQCDAISDILTCSYVIGHKLSPLSSASSPRCTSGSLHLCLLQEYKPWRGPLWPPWEERFPVTAAKSKSHSLIVQGNKRVSSSDTHLPNKGHLAGLDHCPEKPVENLVLMADHYESVLYVSSF